MIRNRRKNNVVCTVIRCFIETATTIFFIGINNHYCRLFITVCISFTLYRSEHTSKATIVVKLQNSFYFVVIEIALNQHLFLRVNHFQPFRSSLLFGISVSALSILIVPVMCQIGQCCLIIGIIQHRFFTHGITFGSFPDITPRTFRIVIGCHDRICLTIFRSRCT